MGGGGRLVSQNEGPSGERYTAEQGDTVAHVSELWEGQMVWNEVSTDKEPAMAQKEGLSTHLQGNEHVGGTARLRMQLGDRRPGGVPRP